MENPEYPIVVGLSGYAGTGKTSVADYLVPKATFDAEGIQFEHYYLAMPLYRMATAKRKIQGEHQYDRVAYEIHSILQEVFVSPIYGGPTYTNLTKLVHEITSMGIAPDGKPRTFLQTVGAKCRDIDPSCFTNWMQRKVRSFYDANPQRLIFVSDVRFPQEAAMIHREPNGMLVRFDASSETRAQRIEARDGVALTPEQLTHVSEQSVDLIASDWWDLRFATDHLTIAQQAQTTLGVVNDKFGLTSKGLSYASFT